MGGLAMRVAIGCGLHQSGIRADRFLNPDPSNWDGFPRPNMIVEEETRRNTFWIIWAIDMTHVPDLPPFRRPLLTADCYHSAHMDRYDPPSISVDDVWQELPCALQNFNLAVCSF